MTSTGTRRLSERFSSMNEAPPLLMEDSVQIAWDYLQQTGEIDDAPMAGKFLLDAVEQMIRTGERRRLMLSNNAIASYQRFKKAA
jgi:hypothetical protein